MAKEKQNLSILLIEINGVAVYTSQTQTGASFPFPDKIFQNMEITKHEDFSSFIAQICQAQKLTGHHVLIIFGKTLTFEKQTPLLTDEKLEEAIKVFRQSTPFDRVAAKAYKIPTANIIVAINRDLFDTFKQTLERQSIHVIGILPQFVFTQLLGKQPLNAKALEMLFSKEDSIIDQSIVIERTNPKTFQEQEEYLSKRYSGLIVAGFIGFILLILGITGLILRSQFQSVKAPRASVAPAAVQPATPESTVPPSEESSPSGTQITILAGSQNASISAQLVSTLKAQGFEQVITKTQSGVTVQKPLVMFNSALSAPTKAKLSEIFKTLLSDFSVQESTELEEDVSVTLGN